MRPAAAGHAHGGVRALADYAGAKRREVAAMLQMPVGTVTWKNNEALKKLRKYLEKEGRA